MASDRGKVYNRRVWDLTHIINSSVDFSQSFLLHFPQLVALILRHGLCSRENTTNPICYSRFLLLRSSFGNFLISSYYVKPPPLSPLVPNRGLGYYRKTLLTLELTANDEDQLPQSDLQTDVLVVGGFFP